MRPEPDDMDVKRALDTLPRSIEPPEDLWPGIRGRLAHRRLRRWHWPETFEPRTIRIAAGIGIIGIGLTVLAGVTRANARRAMEPGSVARMTGRRRSSSSRLKSSRSLMRATA